MLGNYSGVVKMVKLQWMGFLEGYAWLAYAYIRLHSKTMVDLTKKISDYALANFYDSISGIFYCSAISSSVLTVKKMEIRDNATPSSNSVMATFLYQLSVFF